MHVFAQRAIIEISRADMNVRLIFMLYFTVFICLLKER